MLVGFQFFIICLKGRHGSDLKITDVFKCPCFECHSQTGKKDCENKETCSVFPILQRNANYHNAEVKENSSIEY